MLKYWNIRKDTQTIILCSFMAYMNFIELVKYKLRRKQKYVRTGISYHRFVERNRL